MAVTESLELARRVSLFAGLAHDDLLQILRLTRRVDFSSGATLVRQGEPADSALIMELGKAAAVALLLVHLKRGFAAAKISAQQQSA